ncbi:MAG: N-methylhydantoinase [Alphaproteobacteria bacterium]|jgi:N-methylhydantoinase B|nr:N-methylhydantoinase [Alphaproteobacteria bacterium]
MAQRSNIDPIRLEVLRNAFDTIADEMALILMRTAHSPIVRDSMDYSTALCDAQGRTLAQGVTTPMHLGSFYDAMEHLIERYRDNTHPGDIFIANDPYAAAGQHLPDIYIVEPIFHGGSIVAWATTLAHHADVGGIVPGSNALSAYEIYQEGLRLPFVKLVDRGVNNDILWEVIGLNVRVPDEVLGDLRAQMSACVAAKRGFLEIIERYGMDEVMLYIEELHDYTERLTRAEISDIPNGVYRFTDHIDGLGQNPEPVVIQVEVTVKDDAITADFSGSSKQVPGGINTPIPFTKACVYAALRSIMRADVPNCHGFTRAVTVTAPKGTVVNSVHPAPCGARGITGYRTIDCMFGALAQAVPDRVTADGSGGSTLPSFGGYEDGKPFVFAETFMGTWGAAGDHDGQEGVPHMGANQSNVPVEMIEANYPLRILRYGIVPDTGGAGKYRGGNALTRDYEFLGQAGVFSLRTDKRAFPPHGLFGGNPGDAPVNVLVSSTGTRELPVLVTEPIHLRKGDIFHHITPSGGGYGPANERDPALVLADVHNEKMSVKRAREAYGVVIAGEPPQVDVQATNAARASFRPE